MAASDKVHIAFMTGIAATEFVGDHDVFILPPVGHKPGDGWEYLGVPKARVPELAADYVALIETERTDRLCKCEWRIHPEDVELDTENCRSCHHPHLLHNELGPFEAENHEWECTAGPDRDQCACTRWVDPPRRRKARVDTHPQCPVHTKEGFVMGFFDWLFGNWDEEKK